MRIICEIELVADSGIFYEVRCSKLLSHRFLRYLAGKPKIDTNVVTDEQEKAMLNEFVSEVDAEWREPDGDWQNDFGEAPPGIAIKWLEQLMKLSTSASSVKVKTEKN